MLRPVGGVTKQRARSSRFFDETKRRQRASSVAESGAIGQVRFNMQPGCCQGNKSMSAGNADQSAPPLRGTIGAYQSHVASTHSSDGTPSSERSVASFSSRVPNTRVY